MLNGNAEAVGSFDSLASPNQTSTQYQAVFTCSVSLFRIVLATLLPVNGEDTRSNLTKKYDAKLDLCRERNKVSALSV